MLRLHTQCEVTFLPPYHPTDAEKQDPAAYAASVRQLMLDRLWGLVSRLPWLSIFLNTLCQPICALPPSTCTDACYAVRYGMHLSGLSNSAKSPNVYGLSNLRSIPPIPQFPISPIHQQQASVHAQLATFRQWCYHLLSIVYCTVFYNCLFLSSLPAKAVLVVHLHHMHAWVILCLNVCVTRLRSRCLQSAGLNRKRPWACARLGWSRRRPGEKERQFQQGSIWHFVMDVVDVVVAVVVVVGRSAHLSLCLVCISSWNAFVHLQQMHSVFAFAVLHLRVCFSKHQVKVMCSMQLQTQADVDANANVSANWTAKAQTSNSKTKSQPKSTPQLQQKFTVQKSQLPQLWVAHWRCWYLVYNLLSIATQKHG